MGTTAMWIRTHIPTAFVVACCLALAACNGTAVVTMTATPATLSGFLAYRVRLVSVELVDSKGGGSQGVLPAEVSVDLAQVTSVSEILGAATVRKGDYTSATVTVDYGDAVIVADDGSVAGVKLTPQDAADKAIGRLSLTLQLDPANPLHITTGSSSQFALDFRLSATNSIDLQAATVTVTPLLIASAQPIDAKTVRVRGPLRGADTTNGNYTAAVQPFDGLTGGAGSVLVAPTATTVYEINGVASTGSTGFATLSGLGSGAWTVAYGTLAATTSTSVSGASTGTSAGVLGSTATSTGTTTTRTNISFAPTRVLAASSVQGGGFDRVSGVVTARSGNVLTVPAATWITRDGVASFVSGAATVTVGAGTVVTTPGQGSALGNTAQQVSVGSVIDAFGTASGSGADISLDATAGRVRLSNTVAAGRVTAQGTGSLTVDLGSLGGRNPGAFDFTGTASAGYTQYVVNTNGLNIFNAFVGAPVAATGLVASYGAAAPDFSATSLQDSTTISAELVLDWAGGGSVAPFASLAPGEIDVPTAATGFGARHAIATGDPIPVDVASLGADLLIDPANSSTQVFAIAHQSTATVEIFNTFAAFITALQGELDGTTAAMTLTAEGTYTATSTTLAATSITISLNM